MKRVLLVDPDIEMATMYRFGLEQAGLAVDTAPDAKSMFAALDPSLSAIVMEWEGLGLTGPQILDRIRLDATGVPVVVLTNLDGDVEQLSDEGHKAGARLWLVKANTTPTVLAQTVVTAIDQSKV